MRKQNQCTDRPARSLKPPHGIYVSTLVVFHPDLAPGVKDTLVQLMALAWRPGDGAPLTPPLSFAELAELTGKSVRTLYKHLAELRDVQGVLRVQPCPPGRFQVCLVESLFTHHKHGRKSLKWRKASETACQKLQTPLKEEESLNPILTSKEQNESILLLNDSQNFRKILRNRAKRRPQPGIPRR